MKLAITGKLGAGKDVAVDYLVAMYEFFPFTFSAKGKALFYELFPELRGDAKQRQPMRDFIEGIKSCRYPALNTFGSTLYSVASRNTKSCVVVDLATY